MTLQAALVLSLCLLTLGLPAASALAAGHRRTPAALGVGALGLAAWLWPAFLAWLALHPGGRAASFLMAHGLSAAALLLPVMGIAGVWGAWSLLSACFPLPSHRLWNALMLTTHAASALAVILTCAGLTALALPLAALWSLRPIAFIYLRLNPGLAQMAPAGTARPMPGFGHLRAGIWVLGLAMVLAVTASLWPRSGWSALNLQRVAELRQMALQGFMAGR